jgi:DNA helicase HerA-like ATPase
MDNDALMRRINAATDAKKAAASAKPAVPATPAPRVRQADPVMRQSTAIPASPPPVAPQAAAAQSMAHQTIQQRAPIAPVAPASQPAAPTATAPVVNTVAPAAPASAVPETNKPLMSFRPEPEKKETVGKDSGPRPMRKEDRPQAFVVACNGSMAIVQGNTSCVDTITGLTWAVGRMLSIIVGDSRIVGMICDIDMPTGEFSEEEESNLRFQVELQGEVTDGSDGKPSFSKGISSYPGVGSVVHQIRAADLASLYAATGSSNAVIGALSQDDSIPAYVDVADMLSKHFAVLGSTGCGKSASVSLLLHAAQEIIPDLRTITLDPHNEYSRAFPEANTIEQSNLDLPFWMFQLEEYVEVLFRGKPLVHEEVDALREFIPNAKAKFRDGEDRVKLRTDSNSSAFTADTAVPYRMADLLSEIDEEMGLLESRYDKSVLKSLKARINAHTNDSRYAFMFRHRTIEDIAAKVIGNFFGLPGTGALSTIIQMAGMPAEVVNSVASVLCRLSFELAIAAKGNLKILVVCEEAHRYVPAGKGGFEPTRRAIARIAKEGRKYGSFMAIISQRPSELDPTILSQCSTVFSLRLTNDFDQEIIRKAISSSSASTIAFISSLSNRECIAFGEGMSTPMRMKFRNLPKQWLPGAEADVFGNSVEIRDQQQCAQVFQQWRGGAR